jgi:hypothetical protein
MRVRDTKKAARERKKRIEKGQRQGALEASRLRFRALMQDLGLTKPSAHLLNTLQQRRYREPLVAATPCTDGRKHEQVVRDVRVALSSATVELKDSEARLYLRSFFADYLMLVDACRAGLDAHPRTRLAWEQFAVHLMADADDNIRRGLHAMTTAVDAALLRHCRFDEGLFFARYDYGRYDEKPRMSITIEFEQPPVHRFRKGETQPAWRCGLPYAAGGIEWVDWTAETRGASPERGPAPVYLHQHALERLRQRLPFGELGQATVQDFAWQSLRRPMLIPQRGGWLVEFNFWQWRLGYFVAEEIDEKILIKSFLFLTMDGTPEGRQLRRRLGMKTDQIAYLRADTLQYFIASDVQHDIDLRRIFTECGCGHLFEMLVPEARTVRLPGTARETRRHLGLPKLPPLR